MKNRDRMEITIRYNGGRFGTVSIHSPVGGRCRALWVIGSAVLLLGGWLMFGRSREWLTATK